MAEGRKSTEETLNPIEGSRDAPVVLDDPIHVEFEEVKLKAEPLDEADLQALQQVPEQTNNELHNELVIKDEEDLKEEIKEESEDQKENIQQAEFGSFMEVEDDVVQDTSGRDEDVIVDEVKDDVTEDEVKDDVTEDEVKDDGTEDEVKDDVTEDEVKNDVTEDEVKDDVTEDEVKDDDQVSCSDNDSLESFEFSEDEKDEDNENEKMPDGNQDEKELECEVEPEPEPKAVEDAKKLLPVNGDKDEKENIPSNDKDDVPCEPKKNNMTNPESVSHNGVLKSKTEKMPAHIGHTCPECGKSFVTAQKLLTHSKVHVVFSHEYKCPECNRRFDDQANFGRHLLKTHPESKLYKCDECGKKFNQLSILKKHLRIHSTDSSSEEVDHYAVFRHPKKVVEQKESKLPAAAPANKNKKSRNKKKGEVATPKIPEKPPQKPPQKASQKSGTKQKAVEKTGSKTLSRLKSEYTDEFMRANLKIFKCLKCRDILGTEEALIKHMKMHEKKEKEVNAWKCRECPQTCSSLIKLKLHVQAHRLAQKTNRKCDKCEEVFHSEEALQSHLLEHSISSSLSIVADGRVGNPSQTEMNGTNGSSSSSSKHFCPDCGQTFIGKIGLARHNLLHITGGIKPDCFKCDASFETLEELREHSRTHLYELAARRISTDSSGSLTFNSQENWGAEREGNENGDNSENIDNGDLYDDDEDLDMNSGSDCELLEGEEIDPADLLEMEVEEVDEPVQEVKELSPLPYKCQRCGHGFALKSSVVAHLRSDCRDLLKPEALHIRVTDNDRDISTNKFKCAECGIEVNGFDTLKVHIAQHTKDHRCNVCGELFQDSNKLKAHLRKHLEEDRPAYQCSECSITLPGIPELKEHVKSHVKNHKCQVCAESFTDTLELKTHLKGHMGENQFKCDECGEQLDGLEHLKEHNREMHTTEHKCQMCAKVFPDPEEYKLHLRAHAGEKPFRCHPCDKGFYLRENYENHLQRHARYSSTTPDDNRPISTSPIAEATDAVSPSEAERSDGKQLTKVKGKIIARKGNSLSWTTHTTKGPVCQRLEFTPVHKRIDTAAVLANPVFPPAQRSRSKTERECASALVQLAELYQMTGQAAKANKLKARAKAREKTKDKSNKRPQERVTKKAPEKVKIKEEPIIVEPPEKMRKHPRSGQCPICLKMCSRLDKHMMVHYDQKPHQCPFCPQAFRQSEHLRRHVRAIHEGNHRVFGCPRCHKRLTRKDKLKEHMRNCHKILIDSRALPGGEEQWYEVIQTLPSP